MDEGDGGGGTAGGGWEGEGVVRGVEGEEGEGVDLEAEFAGEEEERGGGRGVGVVCCVFGGCCVGCGG